MRRAARADVQQKTDTITILGLDPSTVATGWALLSVEGQRESVVASGVYHPSDRPSPAEVERYHPHDLRLRDLYLWLRGVLGVYKPLMVAIEIPFYRLNAKTLITLAQVGAALRLAATVDVEARPVIEIAPAERCMALGLAGNATKQQVLYTVNAVYNLNLTDHNEADAVAIAAAGAAQWRQEQMKNRK